MRHAYVRFIYEFYSHWEAAWLGTVSLLVSIYLWARGAKELSWGGFAIVAFACFVVASYQVWTKKDAELERLEGERDVPELFLEFIPESCSMDCSGFFLKTQGEKWASNVRLSSEEVVGDGHMRLRLEWENPGQTIEDKPVHVKVMCRYGKGGQASHTDNLVAGDQIRHFFNRKSQKPFEVIVTVSYTDVAGHSYPDRKFLIRQHANPMGKYLLDERITCEPVPQAAS